MNHSRPIFLKLALAASMLLWASIAVTPARAADIVFSFTGIVDNVHDKLSSEFNEDEILTGSMTVNPLDTNVDPNIGHYAITMSSFTLNIGGDYTAAIGTSGQVEIKNGLPGQDEFNVIVNGPFTVGNNVNFLGPRTFDIQLHATGGAAGIGTAFDSDALPTIMPPPSIGDFGLKNEWRLIFGPDGDGVRVSGPLTTLTAVPLPPAVILFGAGLVALIGLGAGSWRQKKNSFA